jgi:hypothetical protein
MRHWSTAAMAWEDWAMTQRKIDNTDTMWELLPAEIQDTLQKAFEEKKGKPKPERGGEIRTCPHCGEKDTTDCDQVLGIEDSTIGLCIACGYLWCLECDAALLTSILCGHWQICAYCGEKKDSSGSCKTVAWKCKHVKAWLNKNHPTV